MYILVPDSESVPWYPYAGMALVTIPWLSWFLIFLYRCCRPINVQYFDENHQNYGKGTIGTPKSAMATNVTSPRYAKSSDDSPVGGGGERHVQFGAVVEMGDGFGGGGEQVQHLQHESNEEQAVPSLVIVK